MSSFVGGLAGQGVNVALGGDFTLNVLNLGFLAGKEDSALNRLLSTGLLELHLGKEGATMNIGSGGTDVSLGTVSAAVAGLKDAGKMTAAKLEALLGKTEKLSTLSAINKLGSTGNGLNREIAKAVWDGELDLEYGDIKGRGEYQRDGGKVIISRDLLGGGKEGSAKLATVLAHEGTHVAGNRIEGIAHLQGSGTYQAITAMFGLQGDDAFRGEMDAAISDPESWKENTGNIDHWEQKKDGSIFDDGNDGVISFEDGRETIYTQNKGKQGSLEEYLEMEKGTGYELLRMRAAGFAYDDATKTWTGGGTISADIIKSLINEGIIPASVIATPETQTGSIAPNAAPEAKTGISAFWDGIKNSTVGKFIGGVVDLGKSALDGAKNSMVGKFIGGVIDKLTSNTNAKKEEAVKVQAENVALPNPLNELPKDESRAYPNQKEIGKATGLPENSTYLVSSWAYLYMDDNPTATENEVYKILKGQKGISIDSDDSTVKNATALSKALADGLGGGKYGGKIYQYPFPYNKETKTNDQVEFTTMEGFYKSSEIYKYAICEYNRDNGTDKPDTHFTFIDRAKKTEIDPWPGGISTTWAPGTYWLAKVMPIGLYR